MATKLDSVEVGGTVVGSGPIALTVADIEGVVAKFAEGGPPVQGDPYMLEMMRHVEVLRTARRFLAKWRKRLWIPQHWDIELSIFCPPTDPDDALDGVLGICDWGYRPNAHFVIKLRCNLDKDELEWVLVHELLEALLSDYGEFCLPFYIESDDAQWRERMDRDHHRIRDTLIEHLLHGFFGRHSAVRFRDNDQ